MTLNERLSLLKNRIDPCETQGFESNELFNALLEAAKGIILEVRFPCSSDYHEDVEEMYHSLQVSIALELYNKMGAEGQLSHSENKISRTYSSGDVSLALISRITPKCGV